MHGRSGWLEVLQQVQERVRPGGRPLRVGQNKSGANWVHIKRRWNVRLLYKYVLLTVRRVLRHKGAPGERGVHTSRE